MEPLQCEGAPAFQDTWRQIFVRSINMNGSMKPVSAAPRLRRVGAAGTEETKLGPEQQMSSQYLKSKAHP